MDTVIEMSDEEKIQKKFFNPQTYTMAEALSLPNNMRLSLDPVQIKSVSVIINCFVVCLSMYK